MRLVSSLFAVALLAGPGVATASAVTAEVVTDNVFTVASPDFELLYTKRMRIAKQ